MSWWNNTFGAITRGLDSSVGNVVSDPSPENAAGLVRDVVIEALPGDQRTDLDAGGGRGVAGTVGTGIQVATDVNNNGATAAAVSRGTQSAAGTAREAVAEKGLGSGIRKAGQVFGRRIPAMLGRVGTGTAASGGALALPLTIWGVGETLDIAAEAITGRGILDHAQNPNAIRGRSGAQRANRNA